MDMRELRKTRTLLLRATDYWFLPDAPGDAETNAALYPARVAYRQALRDLPDTVDPGGDIGDVPWPDPPT